MGLYSTTLSKGEKAVKTGVSFPPSMLEHIKKTASEKHGGNVSRLVQEAVDKYLKGDSGVDVHNSSKPLSELSKHYLAARFEFLNSALEENDQNRILMRLLDALADFVDDNGEEVVELMEKYQYTLEMHFHKPVAFEGLPKKSKTGYSISAHTDAKKVAEDPPEE